MRLAAAESATDALVCVTEPSLPGEPMRTGTFWFVGMYWVDVASDVAD